MENQNEEASRIAREEARTVFAEADKAHALACKNYDEADKAHDAARIIYEEADANYRAACKTCEEANEVFDKACAAYKIVFPHFIRWSSGGGEENNRPNY